MVRSRSPGATQERCRNSTATRTGANRAMMRSTSARWASPAVTNGGSCSRTPPSLPPIGPSASRRLSITASRSSWLGLRMRPRLSGVNGSSRSGTGRRPGSDGWPEMTWWAFTKNRKSSGVRRVHAPTVSTVGSA